MARSYRRRLSPATIPCDRRGLYTVPATLNGDRLLMQFRVLYDGARRIVVEHVYPVSSPKDDMLPVINENQLRVLHRQAHLHMKKRPYDSSKIKNL